MKTHARWRWLCAAIGAGSLLIYCQRARVPEAIEEIRQVVGLIVLPLRMVKC